MKGRLDPKMLARPVSRSAPVSVREALRSPYQPLGAGTRAVMQPRFGHDFGKVRVHADQQAGESAQALDARAYTVGPDVVFAPGQYAPGSPSTNALLMHELAHVVQQSAAPADDRSLAIGSPADAEEREAHAVQNAYLAGGPVPRLSPARPAIHRQPAPPSGKAPSTITDPAAFIRTPDFKLTRDRVPVGTRVDVLETKITAQGTFVNVVEHGTGKVFGWTARSNLGEAAYAKAGANFVYEARVAPATGHPDMLPVMVYLSPTFDGTTADIVVYFHGDAADYAADIANNYTRENPAIGMDLKAVMKGSNQIIIAPQVNVLGGDMKSPWNTLGAGDYESIVQTVLTNLKIDLGLKAPIPRGAFSIAGHSGGGKALGQATKDLDPTGRGVADVTLVEAGYGGGEGDRGVFSKSFVLARDWLLEGRPGKVIRVITKATSVGTDTRHAIENNPRPDPKDPTKTEAGRIPVLGLAGVKTAIKAKKLDADLQADQTDIASDPKTRTGGMQLIRTIVVSRKKDPDKGKVQGTIFVFLMKNPPRAEGVDTHFGVRDATIRDIVSGRGKGDTFGVAP
jgi:hypothetical protein